MVHRATSFLHDVTSKNVVRYIIVLVRRTFQSSLVLNGPINLKSSCSSFPLVGWTFRLAFRGKISTIFVDRYLLAAGAAGLRVVCSSRVQTQAQTRVQGIFGRQRFSLASSYKLPQCL